MAQLKSTVIQGTLSVTDKISEDGISLENKYLGIASKAASASIADAASSVPWTGVSDRPGNATTSAAGLMSASDKTKLDGIATGANNYTLPTAATGTLGGIKVGTNLSINASGVLSATDTTYGAATTSAAGLMSASDKTKLDGIATGANNYTLPTAATGTLGGIKVGTNLSINASGVLSATDTTYGAATTSAAGLMSAADKTKLDGIASGANNYTLPTAATGTLGGIKVGTNLSINASGVLSATDTTYGAATTSAAGLMSAADKTKLNGIATGANNYTLPTAATGTLGGIKVGTNLSINAAGVLSATDTTYGNATTSAAGLMSASDKVTLNNLSTGAELKSNKVTTITSSSTDTQYPSAKSVYTYVQDNKFDVSELEELSGVVTVTGSENYITGVAVTGSGNVVSSATAASGTITLSKGITALTSLATGTSGSGNVITDITVSGNKITKVKGITALTAVADAGASTKGLVNTGAQTFAGNKTFNGNVVVGGATGVSLAYSTTGSDRILTVSFI